MSTSFVDQISCSLDNNSWRYSSAYIVRVRDQFQMVLEISRRVPQLSAVWPPEIECCKDNSRESISEKLCGQLNAIETDSD
jgi:hypothetical protein